MLFSDKRLNNELRTKIYLLGTLVFMALLVLGMQISWQQKAVALVFLQASVAVWNYFSPFMGESLDYQLAFYPFSYFLSLALSLNILDQIPYHPFQFIYIPSLDPLINIFFLAGVGVLGIFATSFLLLFSGTISGIILYAYAQLFKSLDML